MKKQIFLSLSAALLCTSAWAINKCQVGGKTLFQDAPCPMGTGGEIEVRPASGKTRAAAPAAASAGTTPQAGQASKNKYSDFGDKLERERKGREAWYARRSAANAVDKQLASCREEQATMEREKRNSNNNLAGATRDTSISSKMEAAATLCKLEVDTRVRELESAKAECSKFDCDNLVIAQ